MSAALSVTPNAVSQPKQSRSPTDTSGGETPKAFKAYPIRAILAIALIGVATPAIWFGLDTLAIPGRAALIVFAIAVVAWSVLRMPETPVAIAGGLALVAVGATTSEKFYGGIGDDLIWLLIGAFVLAAVLKQSGLAERFTLRAISSAGNVQQLFYRLTWVIAATAFIIPSTSGRAALLLPVFLTLVEAIDDRRLVRALALLFPTVILLSACASLLGAGAHMIAVDFMVQSGQPAIDFAQWALLGTPFAIISSFAATAVILKLFLQPGERVSALVLPKPQAMPITRAQVYILLVTLLTIALWATSSQHGVDAAVVALGGALLATWKSVSGIALKEALKGVEWNLILFLAATLVMGEALIHSGAAAWIADAAINAFPVELLNHPVWLVAAATLISMAAHLIIASRSARAMVLIPTVALPLAVAPLEASALIFITVVGSGFCQTLKVSAKPVALYAKLDVQTYSDADLARLSFWLMPIIAALLIVFAVWVWPLQGLVLVG